VTPPYRDVPYFLNEMKRKHFQIAANEWDSFYESNFDSLRDVAVFATTFRHPVGEF
jgi:hypothetical protein